MSTFERLGYCPNIHSIAEATGIGYAKAVTGRGEKGWAYGGREFHERAPGGDCWDAMTAAVGIERWVTATKLGGWWPISIVEKAKALGLVREGGRPMSWREGRPCDETITGDWTSHRCERVAVGFRPVNKRDPERGQLAVCGMHQKAAERRAASEAEWRANFDASIERSRRAAEHLKLAEELLEWAGPILAELGIHPKTITAGSIGERTGLLLPAEAVATLIEEACGERYPGRAPMPSTEG